MITLILMYSVNSSNKLLKCPVLFNEIAYRPKCVDRKAASECTRVILPSPDHTNHVVLCKPKLVLFRAGATLVFSGTWILQRTVNGQAANRAGNYKVLYVA
ncbi:hypothetical protein J6590_107060, partial [Homalodisca vitripennis]